jgi:hypothetical protein
LAWPFCSEGCRLPFVVVVMKFLSSRSKIIQHHNNFKKAEVMFSQTKRDPLSTPLNKAPPGHQPCAPTLLLGLPSWVAAELGHVLRNDLAFGLTSKWYWAVPLDVKLTFLEFVNGESLIQMTPRHSEAVFLCAKTSSTRVTMGSCK